ncbi:MAG: sigma-70 family RNA polymerase sigma factor [Gammaproteobacteria bacterium]|nr:sigma-70 family RNA polymerase sigma factor [Gammaproteobacteria bacterium]
MAEKLDPNAWLDRYGDVLFRYAVARVRDKTVAEDLVQDAFLAAIGAVATYEGGSTEQTWLVGILRHKVLDYFRQSSREKQLQHEWSDEQDHDFDDEGSWAVSIDPWRTPEKAVEQDEFWGVLRGCVDTLPENLRTVFALRELDGLGTEELLATLDISTKNNLWVMLSRARKRLRQCLQNRWFEKWQQDVDV